MSTSPNIRPPCGQSVYSEPIPTLGGCGQFFNFDTSTGSAIKIKYNTTQMLNYSGSPTWIPVLKTAEGGSLESSCSPYASDPPQNFVCGNGINGNLWCHQDMTGSWIQACNGTSSISFPVGKWHNCYSQSNDTASNDPCSTDSRALGFKNLYASKRWIGRLSYTSRDLLLPDCWDWCCDGCVYHTADTGSPDNTRYRTVSATATENLHTDVYNCGPPDPPPEGDFCCADEFTPCDCGADGCPGGVPISCTVCTFDHSTEFGGDASATTTIDIYGNTVVASCFSSSHGCSGDGAEDCEAQESAAMLGKVGAANTNAGTLIDLWCGYLKQFGQYAAPDVITGGCGSWHLEWNTVTTLCFAACGGAEDSTPEHVSVMDITPSTLDIYKYGPDRPQGGCNNEEHCVTWIQTEHSHWDYGETGFNFTQDITGEGSISFNQQYHQEVHGSLADPYTIEQVYAEVVSLMDLWDLGDDQMMPWRRDAATTTGPVVRRDEGGGEPSVPVCKTDIRFTGAIRGQPAPAGIDKVWDFEHPNYCICTFVTDEQVCYMPYILDWGAWSTDCGTPRATCWLDGMEALDMPQGAFVGSNFSYTHPSTCNADAPAHIGFDNVLWACKYAEAIYPKQSFNYARPCGIDRFAVSESSNRCISSISGDTITIENTGPTTDISSEPIWVCGTGTMDGLWSGSSDMNYTITLTEPRLISASMLPSQPVENCGSGVVYKLRWKNVPGICGKLAVNAANNSNPVTCSLENGAYLVNGDTVEISGSLGLTQINGSHIIKVIDTNTIALIGVNGVSQSIYKGGGLAGIPFAPDWKWNDTGGKGDFTYRTWDFNYRDVGEYQRVLAQKNWNLGIPYNCTDGPADSCPEIPPLPANPREAQSACGLDPNVASMSCNTTCLPFNICGANAAYFSPNVESFDSINAKNCGWIPSGVHIMDSNYITMWQGAIIQAMDDPYFQAPPCPCAFDADTSAYNCNACSWNEDNGSCQTDQAGDPDLSIPCLKYYAARNVYEARCEVPNGAPPMMPGGYIGCLKPSQFGGSCPPGNICNAPVLGTFGLFPEDTTCNTYLFHNYSIPWILLLTKEQCVCSGGRFADVYSANQVSSGPTCSNIVEPP